MAFRLALVFKILLLAGYSATVMAQAPDPAPSTPVETVELMAFEPTREEAVLEAYVDGIVGAHMRQHRIPGVSVSIVRNGRPLFEKGYGDADIAAGRAADETTLFRIGSVSKTFIWTAVMILHDRGEIDLDADVNQYLNGIEIPEKFGAPVTMNDLMAHRAGFEDSFGVFTLDPAENLSLTEALLGSRPARVYPPGARTSYSNWGSALAAKIIEDISGKSYRDFLFDEILQPLSMDATALYGPEKMSPSLKASLSKGYKIDGGTFVESDLMNIGELAPAGAMSLSAEDMSRWMLFHLNNGALDDVRLMRPETHRAMWTRGFTDNADGADLAHGFFNKTYKGVETFSHGGATASFFTYMSLAPALNLGVYVSQNATTDRMLVTDLPALIIDHLTTGADVATAIDESLSKDDFENYAGVYFDNRRSFKQFEKLFAATQFSTVTSSDDGVVLARDEAVLYRPVAGAPDTFENDVGLRIVFGRDENGAVSHLTDQSAVHSRDRARSLDNANLLGAALGGALFFALTTLLGAWRRQGRPVQHKSAGVMLNLFGVVAAIAVVIFAGSFGAALMSVSNADVTGFAAYPFAPIGVFRMVAYVVLAISTLAIASLAPAWVSSGWSMWRKLHHSAFALSLAFLSIMLVWWRVIFSATA